MCKSRENFCKEGRKKLLVIIFYLEVGNRLLSPTLTYNQVMDRVYGCGRDYYGRKLPIISSMHSVKEEKEKV